MSQTTRRADQGRLGGVRGRLGVHGKTKEEAVEITGAPSSFTEKSCSAPILRPVFLPLGPVDD